MKKINYILTFIFVFSFLLVGCGKKIKLNDKYEKIIKYSIQSSYGAVEDLYKLHMCVKNDNTIEIYGSYNQGNVQLDYIEGITVEITEEEKNNIVKTINRNSISLIPKDVSSPSMDGSYYSLIFYEEDGTEIKECKGLNPMHRGFKNICRSICKCITDEEMKQAKEKIKDIVLENFKIEK